MSVEPPLVFICINGIRARPGDDDGWTDRAVTGLMLRGLRHGIPIFAEKYEYFTPAITRRLHQQRRAEGIAKMVGYWQTAGARVSLVAHSNGGDLAERVLDLVATRSATAHRHISSAHLYAPACDGLVLAAALRSGLLGHLYLHGQPNDPALRLGALSGRLFGWAGLGYGDLGRRVTEFGREQALNPGQFTDVVGEWGDHSHWFRPAVFETTLDRLVWHEFPATAPNPAWQGNDHVSR